MRRALGFFGQVAKGTGVALASTAVSSATYSAGSFAIQQLDTKPKKSEYNQDETNNNPQLSTTYSKF